MRGLRSPGGNQKTPTDLVRSADNRVAEVLRFASDLVHELRAVHKRKRPT